MSLAIFNFIRVLASLTWYLDIRTISSIPLKLSVLASCFVFEFVQEHLFHPCWIPGIFFWLSFCWDALLYLQQCIYSNHSWAWRFLNINQLSWALLPTKALSHSAVSSRSLKRPKSVLWKSRVMTGTSKGNCSALHHSKLHGWMSMMRRSSPEALLVSREGGQVLLRHWEEATRLVSSKSRELNQPT